MHDEPKAEPATPDPSLPNPGSESESGIVVPEDARELLQELYQELRALAAFHLRGERADHPLQPTALLHEAYLRLHGKFAVGIENRAHLMALISRTMRRVLVDHARMSGALKRAGSRVRVTFHPDLRITDGGFEDLLDLHLVLERFKQVDARAAQVAEWQLFGGFTQAEIAEHLGVSDKTVRNDYAVARSWLRRELAGTDGTPQAPA